MGEERTTCAAVAWQTVENRSGSAASAPRTWLSSIHSPAVAFSAAPLQKAAEQRGRGGRVREGGQVGGARTAECLLPPVSPTHCGSHPSHPAPLTVVGLAVVPGRLVAKVQVQLLHGGPVEALAAVVEAAAPLGAGAVALRALGVPRLRARGRVSNTGRLRAWGRRQQLSGGPGRAGAVQCPCSGGGAGRRRGGLTPWAWACAAAARQRQASRRPWHRMAVGPGSWGGWPAAAAGGSKRRRQSEWASAPVRPVLGQRQAGGQGRSAASASAAEWSQGTCKRGLCEQLAAAAHWVWRCVAWQLPTERSVNYLENGCKARILSCTSRGRGVLSCRLQLWLPSALR